METGMNKYLIEAKMKSTKVRIAKFKEENFRNFTIFKNKNNPTIKKEIAMASEEGMR